MKYQVELITKYLKLWIWTNLWAEWHWGGENPSYRQPLWGTVQCHLKNWCQLKHEHSIPHFLPTWKKKKRQKCSHKNIYIFISMTTLERQRGSDIRSLLEAMNAMNRTLYVTDRGNVCGMKTLTFEDFHRHLLNSAILHLQKCLPHWPKLTCQTNTIHYR